MLLTFQIYARREDGRPPTPRQSWGLMDWVPAPPGRAAKKTDEPLYLFGGRLYHPSAMIRFKVFENGAPARSLNLDGAHLLGTDRVPIRAEFKFAPGELICEAGSRGAAALAVMWPVKGVGRVLMETPRLVEQNSPYNLHVELARGQFMRISQKREDWGLYDCPEGQPLYSEIDKARDLLVAAMTAGDDLSAARHADEALAAGTAIGEKVGVFNADTTLGRRRKSGQLPRRGFGCRVDPSQCSEAAMARAVDAFDFASLPLCWSSLQPKEGKYDTAAAEKALQMLHAAKMPIWGCSLLSFEAAQAPPWLPKVARDYDRLRDAVVKHLRTIFKNFEGHVQSWEVVTGLHAHNPFKLSFEQIMELTRMAAILARQHCPKSQVVLGVVLPWGEYYANDPQSIPPRLYAEMAMQSGIPFDAFGLALQFGGQHTAQYVRDTMQISSILDRFGDLGKPLQIVCAGVPSAGLTPVSGYWHDEWSEAVQSEWARDFYRIALAKPFVESVTWQTLTDGVAPSPWGGVLHKDLTPKASYQQIQSIRKELSGA